LTDLEERTVARMEHPGQPLPRRRARPLKSAWKAVRGPLANSRIVKNLLASLIALALRFIGLTNRRVAGGGDLDAAARELSPAIVALWHGQHLLAPIVRPRNVPMTAMFSRSADAELNALVAEKLGFGIVRGSGGRADNKGTQKGGASALIALKKVLDGGTSVAMIADIAHATAREAGMGVVTLAKHSGRPIVPVALATSRRKVIEKSWDKTTVNLPFGRSALVIGEPVHVPADSDEETVQRLRAEVTQSLNRATEKAYRLVDGVS
jgi:lysophospholipid acyltransferase (LPLAT)-like uncharacterized protein